MYTFLKEIVDSINYIKVEFFEKVLIDCFFKKFMFWYKGHLKDFQKQFDAFCEKDMHYFYNGNFLVFCSDYKFFFLLSFVMFLAFFNLYIVYILFFFDYLFFGDKTVIYNYIKDLIVFLYENFF